MMAQKDNNLVKKLKRWGCLLLPIIIVLLTWLSAANFPEKQLQINLNDPGLVWQVSRGTLVSKEASGWQLTRRGEQFYIVFPQLTIEAASYDVCQIEFSSPIAYDLCGLLFSPQFNRQLNFNLCYEFNAGPAGKTTTQLIYLARKPAWRNQIKGLLLVPGKNAEYISLKSLKLIKANPWTKVEAWWSDFTRYYDIVGDSFAMPYPFLLWNSYQAVVIPLLLVLLAGAIIVRVGLQLAGHGKKYGKIPIVSFFVIFLLFFFLLDMRNNCIYLKSIRHNISLYWGKPLEVKRGLVIGDPKFVSFVEFCDREIPLNAKIYNLVPASVSGTPDYYLSDIQLFYLLRPRLNSFYRASTNTPEAYYVLYGSVTTELYGVDQRQIAFERNLVLQPGGEVRQEIIPQNRLNNLRTFKLTLAGPNQPGQQLKMKIMDGNNSREVASAELLSFTGSEMIFRLKPLGYYQGEKIVICLLNNGPKSINLAASWIDNSPGTLKRDGKREQGDLVFQIDYSIKRPKLFRQLKDVGCIYMDGGE